MFSPYRFRKRLQGRLHDRHGGGGYARGPKMFDAGSLRYIVLQLIAERPRHGYEIIKEIEERVGGGYAPSPGAIYPLLALLEDLGHVEASADGNKKLHRITPEGRAFLRQNRAFVDAVFARMDAGCANDRGGVNAIRASVHDIKDMLRAHAQDGFSEEQAKKIVAILERAAVEIRKLL
ncbi:PadR family transcriptional regulator [Rudaea sp.]|uniref:PadR family transcriptional regulator n=1 Tax=Rudaea sp. TaxID=2136325 RepID=UPI002ED1F8A3